MGTSGMSTPRKDLASTSGETEEGQDQNNEDQQDDKEGDSYCEWKMWQCS